MPRQAAVGSQAGSQAGKQALGAAVALKDGRTDGSLGRGESRRALRERATLSRPIRSSGYSRASGRVPGISRLYRLPGFVVREGGKPRKRVTHNESNFVVCLRSTVRFLLAFLSASGLLWYFWLRTGGALSFRGAASETFCLFYSPYSGLFVRRFFSGFVTKRGLIGVESFMRHRVLGYVSSRLLHYITFATVAVIYFRLFKRSV